MAGFLTEQQKVKTTNTQGLLSHTGDAITVCYYLTLKYSQTAQDGKAEAEQVIKGIQKKHSVQGTK